MSHWVRLWDDLPNDPKWRVVARRAGRPVSEVIAVFIHMLTNAGSAKERGTLEGWEDEDIAIAIDADPEHVAAIREAMQGKTLAGDRLSGWKKRQPAREDGSADRARSWRERKKAEANAGDSDRTQTNASERLEESRVDTDYPHLTSFDEGLSASADKSAKMTPGSTTRGCRLPDGFQPNEATIAVGVKLGLAREDILGLLLDEFCDFWPGVPGSKGLRTDWQGTYRNRLRQIAARDHRQRDGARARAGPATGDNIEAARRAIRERMNGRDHNQASERGTGTGEPRSGPRDFGPHEQDRDRRLGPIIDLVAERSD